MNEKEKKLFCKHKWEEDNVRKLAENLSRELKKMPIKVVGKKLPNDISTPKKYSKRPIIGFDYLGKASIKGPRSKCFGCEQYIGKEEERILYTYFPHKSCKFLEKKKLHCNLKCLKILNKKERHLFCNHKWRQDNVRKLAENLSSQPSDSSETT